MCGEGELRGSADVASLKKSATRSVKDRDSVLTSMGRRGQGLVPSPLSFSLPASPDDISTMTY